MLTPHGAGQGINKFDRVVTSLGLMTVKVWGQALKDFGVGVQGLPYMAQTGSQILGQYGLWRIKP